MNEVYIQKQDIIRRCLKRIEEEYGGDSGKWEALIVQDAIMLNLLRACEAAIDLAMYAVSKKTGSTHGYQGRIHPAGARGNIGRETRGRHEENGWFPKPGRACLSGTGHA